MTLFPTLLPYLSLGSIIHFSPATYLSPPYSSSHELVLLLTSSVPVFEPPSSPASSCFVSRSLLPCSKEDYWRLEVEQPMETEPPFSFLNKPRRSYIGKGKYSKVAVETVYLLDFGFLDMETTYHALFDKMRIGFTYKGATKARPMKRGDLVKIMQEDSREDPDGR